MTRSVDQRLAALERQIAKPDFWLDKNRAQAVIEEHERLKQQAAGEGEYDQLNAVITIFSGAGGNDAEDFSRILYEMYFKFAGRHNFQTQLIHSHPNERGGYRNLTFEVKGRGAYGILKNESGVHRLVRVSPFSAKKLRHTSFSLVEVVPHLPPGRPINLKSQELKIDYTKASGPGGQNVNKRETAVRVVHLPTGLSAASEVERSQERNRDRALRILAAKLYRRQEEVRREKVEGFQISKTTDIEWGNQIRSYILYPYSLVKDHRTGVETSQVEEVLSGRLDEFIAAERN